MASGTRRSLILCFDGTGNRFQGTPADSNIVKILSLLDRQDQHQYHYYQPGIGTYVESSSLARKSIVGRLRSWYVKSKDQAVGTSFGEHVMAGYKFLMRYYTRGDDIYMFGFSRGAYTARFLAQMLDYVGLLTAGNEEMLRFAWKTFAQWQMRTGDSVRELNKKRELYLFMERFRETFCRPIDPIRFLGLFDCVNSVPQFESAWMSRTKFPYTANSSALVIRHAVSIDERRAKFRQDLISENQTPTHHHHHHHHHPHGNQVKGNSAEHTEASAHQGRYRAKTRKLPLFGPHNDVPAADAISIAESQVSSIASNAVVRERLAARTEIQKDTNDEDGQQDILEVWFAGQHGDIGGGWPCGDDERPASDIPLIWMVREAMRAGLPFDGDSLEAHGLTKATQTLNAPLLQLDGRPLRLPRVNSNSIKMRLVGADEEMHQLHTTSRIHDSLTFDGGLSFGAVVAWKVMEWLPFRRMDLQPDGSWRPISWPLPRGEVRDIPSHALIHGSAIRRMEVDPTYRPGNLIIGGGGRGVRRAPAHHGIGEWDVFRERGDRIGEVVVRARLAGSTKSPEEKKC